MIVVIGCGKDKSGLHGEALYLYRGQLFEAHRRLAIALRPRAIYVVSAKYGLVRADQVIETYDLRLADLDKAARQEWARQVAKQVEDEIEDDGERVVVLAGKLYSAWTEHVRARVITLLEGLTVCERRKAVRRLLESEGECKEYDRWTVRERLAVEHERLMVTDKDYRESQLLIRETLARIGRLGVVTVPPVPPVINKAAFGRLRRGQK